MSGMVVLSGGLIAGFGIAIPLGTTFILMVRKMDNYLSGGVECVIRKIDS